MDSIRDIGLDVHRDPISAAVLESNGTLMMQSVPATRTAAILEWQLAAKGHKEFIDDWNDRRTEEIAEAFNMSKGS